jgi:YVTN family beta-propeller protein
MVGINVLGQYSRHPNDSPDGGSNTSYDGWTSRSKNPDSLQGFYYASNAMTNVYWNHQVWFPPQCALPGNGVTLLSEEPGVTEEFGIYNAWMTNTGQQNFPQAQVIWECIVPPGELPELSSQFAFTGNIPSSVTMAGWNPYTSANGMPEMYIFSGTSGNPSFYTEIDASSVDPSGATATFNLPSNMPQNAYAFETVNQNADGTVQHQGSNFFVAASSQTIPGNPFGVAAQLISTTWETAYNPDTYGDETCQGPWTYNSGSYINAAFPVVTQYSLNSVSNGGTTIPVGANPTAIALYGYYDNYDYQDNDPCNTFDRDTTQMANAIVANSGSNTVSILDLVNNVVLSNVVVGNQPVALAVSSDGSTAYVANYTDGTVSQVNLKSNTVTSTVAVGGQPTSVALTAAGTLWTGGAGFLTQVNTQTMSVVATVSSSRTISALAYTDAFNEIVATSSDSSGNVYVDELNPSNVQPSGVYTPAATNAVSTLGTYYNSLRKANVRGHTATLANSASPNSISPVLMGAPPLVVQDGWAVVSATPTGFTISDASGNVVLISETTPSPVTAIAVDTNLNNAYLVMPDSNTILTVPLPGTGSAN